MFTPEVFATVAAISADTGLDFDNGSLESVAGGDINQAYQLSTATGERHFLKLNQPTDAAMFAAERTGLAALAGAEQLRVPHFIATGSSEHHAWLLLEWLDLTTGNANAAHHLGKALANLHQVRSQQFGFASDNTIGRTPQRNDLCDDWVEFYRDFRLQPQLEFAVNNGMPDATRLRIEQVQARLSDWFSDYQPAASLLHGDLWGGNWAMLSNGQPVIFDPAVYYGDREADIAMTRLFGGFPNEFYVAYNAAWALDKDAENRQPLYDLYHVLNHFNLFGGEYLAQADRIVAALLTQ
jgi:protein-ribulosamine 3-kinase